MSKRSLPFLIAVAAFLPVVGLFAWWAQLSFFARTGTIVTFRVTGYDPRDLLSGHYVQYNVDYGTNPSCDSYRTAAEVCLCIAPGQGDSPFATATWSGLCDAKPACPLWLQGSCQYGRFSADIERFYIPEELAPQMRVAPENSSIQVAINQAGRGIVVNYLIDNIPLSQYPFQSAAVPSSAP